MSRVNKALNMHFPLLWSFFYELTLVAMKPGLNFINGLRTAFMQVESKSVKKTVKLSVFLRFRNLHAQKLFINMLVKLTPT